VSSAAIVVGALATLALSWDVVINNSNAARALRTWPVWIPGAIRMGPQVLDVNAVVVSVNVLAASSIASTA
jgi:hypothetical protein